MQFGGKIGRNARDPALDGWEILVGRGFHALAWLLRKWFAPHRRAIRHGPRITKLKPPSPMNSIVYIVGAIVIIVVILKVLGLF